MHKLALALLLLLSAVIFKSWYLPGIISAFDFPYFSKLMMEQATFTQYAWGYHPGLGGLDRFLSPYSWVFPLIYLPQVLFRGFGLDWVQIVRIVYLYPILILSVLSPTIFFRKLFPRNKFYIFSILIYSFNTFAILLFSGQVYLSISYVLFPLIFYVFIKLLWEQNNWLRQSVLLGLLISLSLMADPRITYIGLIILILYLIYNLLYSSNLKNIGISKKTFFYSIITATFIIFLLQSFWIIPTYLYGVNPVEKLGFSYSTSTAVDYLSFAKLENTISLLHPNWPENIFGKVYFMRPEFLIIPILAYTSLLFVYKTKDLKLKTNILFFALLGIIGAFLAKGANEPFGQVYLWLFNNFPGFVMFRDASKWYILVAISYSVLIPFSILNIYLLLSSKVKVQSSKFGKIFNFQNLFLFLVLCFTLFIIRPALFGQLGGTLKHTTVPQDYQEFEKFIYNQKHFFRTLWFPSTQKFGYYSNLNPMISAQLFFNSYDYPKVLENFRMNKDLLQKSSVKYVAVPLDSEKEIFLTDRRYDEKKYLEAVENLEKIPWLKKVATFGKIIVFEVPEYKDHFYISNQQSAISNRKLTYRYIAPVEYEVSVKNAKKGDLIVFSESFDARWIIRSSELKVQSSKFDDRFNSFRLPKDGDYSFEVYYSPQDWVNIGVIVSILTLISIILALVYLRKK